MTGQEMAEQFFNNTRRIEEAAEEVKKEEEAKAKVIAMTDEFKSQLMAKVSRDVPLRAFCCFHTHIIIVEFGKGVTIVPITD